MVNSLNSKNDYRNVVINIMDFLKPYCSNGNTRIFMDKTNSKYNDAAAREGFSKMLWAAVPFINGGGHNINIEDLYRIGTINGTDPASKEYWGIDDDSSGQLSVMAPVACGLLMNAGNILYIFNQNERQNIVKWLYNINGCRCCRNEEQPLVILVNSALKLLGRQYDRERLQTAFDIVEKMYIGNGWYGVNGTKKYNTTLNIQFHSLIYAKTMMGYDEKRCSVYIDRAGRLLSELCKNRYIAQNGGSIALLSFFSACIYADVDIGSLNYTGVMTGMKKAMADYSSKAEKIFSNYFDEKRDVTYHTNADDFITWYMKAFLVLALPQEHRFWRAG